jgi:dihydroorotate dehydrogenase
LAIAAGPLLNGKWILYYASLGFDLLTYKTVRSRPRPCYSLPNLLPVDVNKMDGHRSQVRQQSNMQGSWAISFGMPSQSPEIWRQDVRWTRDQLHPDKRLAVSVVATVEPDWSIQQIADDYARCASWAVESGADFVEINLSCPNVTSCDGQLYQHPTESGIVARVVKEAIGRTPLLAKIGYLPEDTPAREFLHAVADHLDAVIMVNGLATQVVDTSGQPCFDGHQRGIGGQAIHDVCVDQVRRCRDLLDKDGSQLPLVGCGGVSSTEQVRAMLDSGAQIVQIATSAMCEPAIGLKMRQELG